jgi:hypothetical protein
MCEVDVFLTLREESRAEMPRVTLIKPAWHGPLKGEAGIPARHSRSQSKNLFANEYNLPHEPLDGTGRWSSSIRDFNLNSDPSSGACSNALLSSCRAFTGSCPFRQVSTTG